MGTVEKVKGKAPSNQVAAVISTTVNNAVTYRSVLYCTFISCQITPVLTWTMSTIQNQKRKRIRLQASEAKKRRTRQKQFEPRFGLQRQITVVARTSHPPTYHHPASENTIGLSYFLCVCFELSNSRCITFRTVGWRYRRGHPRSYGERRH
jgi:hypothetical protein